MYFILLLLISLSILYAYIGIRIIVPLKYNLKTKLGLVCILVLFLLLPPLSIFFRVHDIENRFAEIISWAGYLTMGYITLSVSLLLMKDTGLATFGLFQFFRGLIKKIRRKKVPSTETPDPERRAFLMNSINMAVMGTSGALTFYGFFQARGLQEVKQIPMYFPHLPDSLEGFRIVQITDVHVGPTLKRQFVEGIVNQISLLNPDVIVLTGDLVDGNVEYLRRDTFPLSELYAPYGRYFVTGNHEYYSGVHQWLEEIERLGFTPLINEHRVITKENGNILMAGVTDYRMGRHFRGHDSSPQKAMADSPLCDLKILLAHQPSNIFEASNAGFDFQISGHTHGGQYFPANIIFKPFHPYLSGLHMHDKTWIYVSSGTGYWGPPLRLGVPSEITLFTLTSSQNYSIYTEHQQKSRKTIYTKQAIQLLNLSTSYRRQPIDAKLRFSSFSSRRHNISFFQL
jgi:uncharacterized protein